MATSAKVMRAGDVSIDEVLLISRAGKVFNITPQVVSFEIYEDIFSPFITGKAYIRDSQELVNVLPLVGEETLQLRISTPALAPETAIEGKFYVWKLDDRMKTAEREWAYVLHFISREAIIDLNKKVSRAYQGPLHTVVEEILTGKDGLEIDKTRCNIEPAKNTSKWISNFWSPVKNLQVACDNAFNENESPSYLFFENKYGFNWITLDSLYDPARPAMHSFLWDNYTAHIESTGGSRLSLEDDYKRVLDFDAKQGFDYIERLKSGMYGSEIIYFDLLSQQYVHKGHIPSWEDNKHLNPFPLWTRDVAARPKSVLIYGKQMYNNFEGFNADTADTKIIQKRMGILGRAEAHKVSIRVFGRTDYSAGQKVFLEIPRAAQITDKSEWRDDVASGNYLAAAVCHQINRKQYTTVMELIKESCLIDLNVQGA